MKLIICTEGDGISVSVSDVPDECTDADVQATFEELARNGDSVAIRALRLVPCFVRMNSRNDSRKGLRVYYDT